MEDFESKRRLRDYRTVLEDYICLFCNGKRPVCSRSLHITYMRPRIVHSRADKSKNTVANMQHVNASTGHPSDPDTGGFICCEFMISF